MSSVWTSPTDSTGSEQMKMDDLSSLIGVAQRRTLFRNFFTGMGIPDVPGSFAGRDYRNAVRLIEKALREWELARKNICAYADRQSNNDKATLWFLESIDHFENMINALHRSCLLLERLKGAPEAPVSKNDLLRPAEVTRIRSLRHASEHVDEFVRRGEIPAGDDLMIRPWCEGLTFASDRIEYSTLAGWLRKLQALALQLVDHDSLAAQRSSF
jgi:hypothetical protein